MGSRGRGPRPGPRPPAFLPGFSSCLRQRPHSRRGFATRALSWPSPFCAVFAGPRAPTRPRHRVFRALGSPSRCPSAHRHSGRVRPRPDPRPAASGSSRAGSVSVHLDNLVPSPTVLALLGCSALNKREQTNKGTPESQCAEVFPSWRPPG